MIGAIAARTGRPSRGLTFFRGAVAFAMTTVILIFIVLLSGHPASELTAVPWDNTVLHYVMPVVVVLDWLLLTPRRAVPLRAALSWLLIPLAYLVYSLVRGVLVDWYPYPFMDPREHGYTGVLLTSAVIAVALAVIAAVVAVAPRTTGLVQREATGS